MKKFTRMSNVVWPKGWWTQPYYEGNRQCASYYRELSNFRFAARRLDPAGIGYSVVPERNYDRLESIECPKNWSPYVPL